MEKKRKLLNRIGSLLAVLLVVSCVVVSPASAAVQYPFDGSDFVMLYDAVGLDRFIFDPAGLNLEIASPFYALGAFPADNGPESISIYYYLYDPADPSDVETVQADYNYSVGSITDSGLEGFYVAPIIMESTLFNNYASFALRSSQPFVCTMSELAALYAAYMAVAPNVEYSFNFTIKARYPSVDTDGGYELLSVSDFFSYSYVNSSSATVSKPMFPMISELENFSQVVGGKWFIVDSIEVTYELYNTSLTTFNNLQFGLVVQDPETRQDFADFMENYPIREVIYEADFPPIQDFFIDVVGGFLDIEIMPGISFGKVFGSLLVICLVVIFLKLFGGG